jgi:hypothetical protein
MNPDIRPSRPFRARMLGWLQRAWPQGAAFGMALATVLFMGAGEALAQETVCAKVKIEIKQELTLERQAFDAEMKINNTTESGVIENVSIVVKVSDEAGNPIAVSDNPNDLSAKFFLRVSNKQAIGDITGSGSVAARTTAIVNWLLIPAPGSAGTSPLGKKYLVGATLKYRFGGEDQTLDVSPDVITVKPLPLLTLDYFLEQNVWGDDPLTAEVEAVEPFTLGVRVKNNGYAAAKNLKIDSAQPKIIENNQGLLINFTLTGSYVDDAPVQNTLLIPFGDIAAGSSKMGRWNMESTLAGKFTEFAARFTHADELGGALTSILQATHAHFLLRDVRVDLPGRDAVKDFLAQDGDVIRVYESDSPDNEVTDRSGVSQLQVSAGGAYAVSLPPTAGFVYVRLPDPFRGTKVLGRIQRSDAKQLLTENVWLSKTRNAQTKQWEHWFNLFDVNTTGVYQAQFDAPSTAPKAPVLQLVVDRRTKEEQQVSFLVEASSPDGKPVSISAAPLPAGATLTAAAGDPQSPTLARAIFDWTPPKGTAGSYLITYTVSDGLLSSARSATIRVDPKDPPPGPGTPQIVSPASGGQVTTLKPTLSVQAASVAQDPTQGIQFEVYRDEAMTQLVASATVPKAPPAPGNGGGEVPQPTAWVVPTALQDNTAYWWRARAFDGGQVYSPWSHARLFVNLFNDPPDAFNLSSPAPAAEVSAALPAFSWANPTDKDGDALTFDVDIYSDTALTQRVSGVSGLPAAPGGQTSWTASLPLSNHVTYHWRVAAVDALGARTLSIARPFVVNTGNTAPTAPVVALPASGAQVQTDVVQLFVQNATDADGDLLTLVFEIDTVNTFDSAAKRTSGQLMQSTGSTSSWSVAGLLENQRYFWRVKAQDGRAESAWASAEFLVNRSNDAPPAPSVHNPGSGAWSATQQPTLEANPILDPEGEAVQYQFEVYTDAALTRRVASGSSASVGWTLPQTLADKTTHWWRVRAADASGAFSAWSPAAVLYVSTGPYQAPSIQVTSPSTPVQPKVVGEQRQVTIQWEGTNPNIEPTIALYHSPNQDGFNGSLIVDGIRQAAGTQSGSYTWDVSALPVGTHHVYGVIYDARGVGRAWAAGAVVIAPSTQSGGVLVSPGSGLVTSEDGGKATVQVRLNSAPVAPVTVPISVSDVREGSVSPAAIVFTPQNWATAVPVTVTGRPDCLKTGVGTYSVQVGKLVTLDPQFIGQAAAPIGVSNQDSTQAPATAGNDPRIGICSATLISTTKVDATTWEYTFTALAGNSGAAINGLTATLTGANVPIQLIQPKLEFGALQKGEAGRSATAVVFRSKIFLPPSLFNTNLFFRWSASAR